MGPTIAKLVATSRIDETRNSDELSATGAAEDISHHPRR